MKFKPGDLVEFIANQREIEPPLKPGIRGTIVRQMGLFCPHMKPCIHCLAGHPWYIGAFDCGFVWAREDAIRLVPPDTGRQVIDWDACVWRPRSDRRAASVDRNPSTRESVMEELLRIAMSVDRNRRDSIPVHKKIKALDLIGRNIGIWE